VKTKEGVKRTIHSPPKWEKETISVPISQRLYTGMPDKRNGGVASKDAGWKGGGI